MRDKERKVGERFFFFRPIFGSPSNWNAVLLSKKESIGISCFICWCVIVVIDMNNRQECNNIADRQNVLTKRKYLLTAQLNSIR